MEQHAHNKAGKKATVGSQLAACVKGESVSHQVEIKIPHLIFVSILEFSIYHLNVTFLVFHVKSQLLLPSPVFNTVNLSLIQLLHHINVMNDIKNQSFQLELEDS